MLRLNRVAADVAAKTPPHAATDITGFGLLGHVCEMAQGSGVGVTIESRAVPLFDRVLELARDGAAPGGTVTNLEAAIGNGWVFADAITPELRLVLCDAQTSGGLLLAVAPERAQSLVDSLHAAGVHAACRIGEVTADRNLRVI